jgi:transcription initiation factor TFIID subunit 12
MATNGSSANSANIITALGNAFKDPSGATMSNDRLAAVLLQNMSQLTDLAKQGKLNHQQIMQVRQITAFMKWAHDNPMNAIFFS